MCIDKEIAGMCVNIIVIYKGWKSGPNSWQQNKKRKENKLYSSLITQLHNVNTRFWL